MLHQPSLNAISRYGLIVISGILVLGSITASVVTDCRPQVDGNHRPLCTSIVGGAGDNVLVIQAGDTVSGAIFGDGVLGGEGGNDTIINQGVTRAASTTTGSNGDLEGDVIALGNGGNDLLINNGIVGGDMDGDTTLNGSGGDDYLINNGFVEDDMDGDNASANGGDDTFIINGVVMGDVQGDDNNDAVDSTGGNDLIVINGRIEGKVDGDFGVQTGGDDRFILRNGAHGGQDNTLRLYGNGGHDTLVFDFVVPDQAVYDAFNRLIATANPQRGSVSFNGQHFTWEAFEQLDNRVTVSLSVRRPIVRNEP